MAPRIYDVFESRRGYPRLKTDMPLLVGRPDGYEAEARFYNLSPDGAQIRYTERVADKLFEDLRVERQVKISSFLLKFNLESDGRDERVVIHATSVYQHKIDDDEYAMGLKFDESDTEMIRIINDYLTRQLEPAMQDIPSDAGPVKVGRDRAFPNNGPPPMERKAEVAGLSVGAEDGEAHGATHRQDPELKAELLRIQGSLKALHEICSDIKQRLIKLERRK